MPVKNGNPKYKTETKESKLFHNNKRSNDLMEI